jgi:hypothetical protein
MHRFLYLGKVVPTKKDADGALARVTVNLVGFEPAVEVPAVPVLTIGASKDAGILWIPEPGDHVIVAKVEGANQWIALGTIYAGKNEPSAVVKGKKNDDRIIRTPAGNEVAFSDKKGEESIRIATKKGCEIFISQKSGKEIISLSSKKDVFIEAKGGGNVTIMTEGKTIVEAKQQVLIKAGPPGIEIVSGGPVKIEGKLMDLAAKMINIKGDMVTVEGKMVTIKGQMVKLGK